MLLPANVCAHTVVTKEVLQFIDRPSKWISVILHSDHVLVFDLFKVKRLHMLLLNNVSVDMSKISTNISLPVHRPNIKI